MPRRAAASDAANRQKPTKLWLNHAQIEEADLDWMAPVESLILWNVHVPDGFLARLPRLKGLSVKGGTRSGLDLLTGCSGLLLLDVNQVRGHPSLEAFEWFWEDEPQRIADPVLAGLAHLDRASAISPDDWISRRLDGA